MGLGDPDHQHPLNFYYLKKDEATCVRCELPIKREDDCYGCACCDHFVHRVCFELPDNMRYPLHPQHSLTLLPSPSLQMDCNRCHEPCLGGYVYHCQACLEFKLHLKCFLTLNLEEKHEHPLCLHEVDINDGYEVTCRTCGLLIDDIDSYTYACEDCEFFIHFDCTFIPPTVKHHHVHELTFVYNYPEESDLAYCDVCEDKDGKELDRTLSYYYCKRCDYIAHVRCVTTKPATVTAQLENFVHEHPMIYSRKPSSKIIECACKNWSFDDSYYFCSQCDYRLHKSCAKFPQFIKHPRHKDHTLSLRSRASLNIEGELPVCNFCSCEMDNNALILQCMDCDYAEHFSCAICFRHPYYAHDLLFSACFDLRFRCNACGELGDGYRMSDNNRFHEIQYDLHLECYALPGKIEHSCHSHLLYLISSPTKFRSDLSTTFRCDVCRTKADSNFWIYCCKQCNYIAHLKCVVSDLLSGRGTTNNFSRLCSITECEEGQFIDHVERDVSTLCLILKREKYRYLSARPIFHNHRCMTPDVTDWNQSSIDVLHCPKCERLISTQAYSCINDWMYCNFKATINNQTPIRHEPLALLDEKLIEELYCPICNQLIFPPTYSCAECQIFFHKSCAELPCEYTEDPGHTFVLLSPSMHIDSLSNCVCCKLPIKGYAYICGSCEIVVDVVCALGAPLLKLENQKHSFFSQIEYYGHDKCKACGNQLARDSIFFKCGAPDCYYRLHFECALLPYIVSHRIHQHPLVLETRLDLSVDDYICDACEKELNQCLWAYRCSDSCGDHATSHVSCIVTSNKKCQFKYDEECRYPIIDHLVQDVPLVRKMSLRAAATALAIAPPEKQRELLRDNIYVLVNELEHAFADIVTGMLLEMDQVEVLHLIESPDALKEKVVEAMEVLRAKPYFQQAKTAKWLGNLLPQKNLN